MTPSAQDDVFRIEQQLLNLQGTLKDAETRNKGLKREIEDSSAKERRSVMEAQLAKVELLKVRQEVMTLKESLEASKSEYTKLKVNSVLLLYVRFDLAM